MTIILAVLMLACVAESAKAQAATQFAGRPAVKISEGGLERLPEELPRERAVNLECVISKIGDKFYWASRENTELLKVESRGFITFLAANGSGYVRIVAPGMKEAVSLMSPTEKRFD